MSPTFPAGTRGAQIMSYKGAWPTIAEDAYVAPGSSVIGNVTLGAESSVWFNCVLRGDDNFIKVGDRTNIQDGTVIHVDGGKDWSVVIGNDVLIGHMALIHGCRIEDWGFVGMGATLMNGVVVEPYAMVAAGALVTPNKRVTSRTLWAGRPAKPVRELTDEDIARNLEGLEHYVRLAKEFVKSETVRP
ncbi:MAG TPA: gamma carbonic anhydrase family protein [Alphaproteobacteria bacterium]|nr:gamma carbonic anhydrase family protein [Alphaproteobacteria bacterium]